MFGAAVSAERMRRIFFFVSVLIPIKHRCRRNKKQACARLAAGIGDVSRSLDVDRPRLIWLLLTTIDIGHCCEQDSRVRSGLLKKIPNAFSLGNINTEASWLGKISLAIRRHYVPQFLRVLYEVLADKAFTADDQQAWFLNLLHTRVTLPTSAVPFY